jgi:hypothetical protein
MWKFLGCAVLLVVTGCTETVERGFYWPAGYTQEHAAVVP